MSNLGRCKDCASWDPQPRRYSSYRPDGWGECRRARYDGIELPYQPRDSTSLAVAEDTEDLFARLATAPDFGCVQFEPKKRLEHEEGDG